MGWRNKVFLCCAREEEEISWDDIRTGKLFWLLKGKSSRSSLALGGLGFFGFVFLNSVQENASRYK